MARYIDADKLIAHLEDEIKGFGKLCGSRANGKSIAYGTALGLKSAISFAQTLSDADVAPKSEVAREIFGDVKKAIKEEVRDYCRGFESMETPEMQEYYKTKQNTAIYLYMKIDHLEKKYTEDKNDG